MAVISRSIPAIPYQGGNLAVTQPGSCAVQLTPTRMVWTYSQTNPNWRYFVIVDTPEGWATGGTPVVTVSRMQDQKSYKGFNLQMARLNDNAFIVFDAVNQGSAGSFSWEVFEITSENVFTRTATNLDPYDNIITSPTNMTLTLGRTDVGFTTTGAKWNNTTTVVPLADNLIGMWFIDSGNGVRSITGSYNTTTKAFTLGPISGNYSTLGYNGAVELMWRAIPGSTKKAITIRSMNTSGSWVNTNNSIHTQVVVQNTDGSIYANYPAYIGLPAILGNSVTSITQDQIMLSENRMARVNWNWAYYHGISGSTVTNDGFGLFSSTVSNNAMHALAMDPNYMMLMDRSHFNSASSGPIKIKIIRREDANMVAQSPGSAVSATGFEVTAPWIDTWRNDSRPRMLPNGDIFWWGLDASGALSWNIMKNAS